MESFNRLQKDILPLPPDYFDTHPAQNTKNLSRETKRRLGHRTETFVWANQGIDAINCIGGHLKPTSPSHSALAPGSIQALDEIQSAYRAIKPLPRQDQVSDQEALRELLSSTGTYSSGGAP